jgi:LuxR family transcriptional regulator, maltose regulon positive regulatory protein
MPTTHSERAGPGLPGSAPVADEPLLKSKLSPPKMPVWVVRRERLERLFSAGVQGPLTVVTGPPGAGKTMAIASWALTGVAPPRLAWLTLDHFDNSPALFWRHLMQALAQELPDLPPDLTAPVTRSSEHELFLRRLAASLAAQSPPLILVLDDIHLLTDPVILAGLDYVLRYASAGVRVVAASRIDPLLPLHRYRLSGELATIRAADLAFTLPEAQQLLATHGVALSPGSLDILMRRNEGWAAGLRLAAMSMAGHPDPEQFVKEFGADDVAVTGYLIEEVLDSQPPDVREVLLKASILERVSDDLACELVGSTRVAGLIPELAEENAFIRPTGHGWYRFHSLFADALRLKLRRQAPHQVPDLRRKAARWLQRHGTVLEAARQATAAGDWPLAAGITVSELAIGTIIDPLTGEPLAALFRELPADVAKGAAAAGLVAAAMAVREQRDEAATGWLSRAEGILDRHRADTVIPCRLAAAEIRFALARRRGDLGAARAACDEAETLLEKLPDDVFTRHLEARAEVLSHRGVVKMWAGCLTEAAELLDQAVSAAGEENFELEDYVGQRALTEAARGRLRRAAELAATSRRAPCASAAAEVALAWTCVERNELGEAGSRLARAASVLHARPDKLVGTVAGLVAARQRLARNDPRAAVETVQRARSGWSPPDWLDRKLILAEAQAFAAAGDPESALASARKAGPSQAPEAVIARARALLAAGDQEAASKVLAAAPVAASEDAPSGARLEAWLMEAELGYRREDPVYGHRRLAQALRLADREQLRLPVAMQRAWIHPVLRRDPELAEIFRGLFDPSLAGNGHGRADTSTPHQTLPVVVEPLTAKEREVLQYAAKMLSTAEIAAAMYVSVNTVKSHFKSIFRKLGVSRRGDAVRRAEQLSLV